MNILQTHHETFLVISLNDFSLLHLSKLDDLKENQVIVQIETIDTQWALFFLYKDHKFYVKNIYNNHYINFSHFFTENKLKIKKMENGLFSITQNKENLCARPEGEKQYFIFKDILSSWESFRLISI